MREIAEHEMATKQTKQPINLIDSFSDFKEFKNIDRQTLINVLEDSFRNVITKMYGSDANYDVIINPDKGDLEIYRNRLVMEDDDVANENTQIGISEALKLDDEAEIGEEVTDKVEFESFGRRMILNLRQTLASRILDLQKENLYLRYSEMLGQVVSGELYQVWKKEMLLLDDEGNELLLPKNEQIPSDFYRKGESARAVVARVGHGKDLFRAIHICDDVVADHLKRLPGYSMPLAEGCVLDQQAVESAVYFISISKGTAIVKNRFVMGCERWVAHLLQMLAQLR